jgi:hypothetical protein
MSSSEYLRKKMAASPKILNTLKPLEASDITTKRRLAASRFFNVNGGDLGTMREDSILQSSKGKATLSYQKETGRPKDSSYFTSFRGAVGINDDAAYHRGKLLTNSNSPGSISACVPIPTPLPTPKDSSTITRERLQCHETKPLVHTSGKVTGPLFVDNTVRIPQITPTRCCPLKANHDIKDIVSFQRTTHGPTKFTSINEEYSIEPPRKTGLLIARSKYIEKHHGNDLNVDPKRPFVKYQPPQGLPVRRINEPRFGQVKPLNGYWY